MCNYVADALSCIPYPEEDQPEVTMTTTDAQDRPPSGIQVNLYYEPDETEIISLEEDVDLSGPDQKSLIEMQAEVWISKISSTTCRITLPQMIKNVGILSSLRPNIMR